MSRKLSREKAMELIFSTMLTKESHGEAIETFVDNYEGNIKEIDLEYIKEVLKGVEENREEIDELIKSNLQKWKIDRISKVNPVSYTHLTLPTTSGWCRSRWSPYH